MTAYGATRLVLLAFCLAITAFSPHVRATEPVPESPPQPEEPSTPQPEEPSTSPDKPSSDKVKSPEDVVWSGVVLPLASANTIDGLGLGVGGELFTRKRAQTLGYIHKIRVFLYANLRLTYTENMLLLERRGNTSWQATISYTGWKSLAYAGVGGSDVMVNWGDLEFNNAVSIPFVFGGVSQRIPNRPLSVYGQLYLRGAWVRPEPDHLLDQRAPLGSDGAFYGDLLFGVELDTTDRWPLPNRGTRGEAAARFAFTSAQDRQVFSGGLAAEFTLWQPLIGKRLVLGFRSLIDRPFGERPFFEQDRVGLRWRDELGRDQILTGYGRTRSRGDGTIATLVDFRTWFGDLHAGWLDLSFFLSVYAEEAWLFRDYHPGPHMPTLGFSPFLLFQGATVLRPFLSFGWQTDPSNGPRRPQPQFGISLMDTL